MAGRAPGSATFRSAPLSVGRVAPPDKPRGFIRSRALWSAGTRAHVPVALRLRGAQLVLEGARSKRKALRFPAAGDPGLQPRRGPADRPAAHEGAVMRRASSPSIRGAPLAGPTPRRGCWAGSGSYPAASSGLIDCQSTSSKRMGRTLMRPLEHHETHLPAMAGRAVGGGWLDRRLGPITTIGLAPLL